MTTATDIASYVQFRHGNRYPDNRRLQKLVYFSQAWSLGWTGKPLFDEAFEAWPDGPVERELWVCQRYSSVPRYEGQLSDDQVEIIEAVLAEYWGCTTPELVDLSHEDVWTEARHGLPPTGRSNTRLSSQSMRRHYIGLALSGKGPKRPARGTSASEASVRDTARNLASRWKDGLDLLASK